MLSIQSSSSHPQISSTFLKGRVHNIHPQRRSITAVRASSNDNKQGKATGDPILEMAVREPISFLGGIVAGFLALDVTQGKRRIVSETSNKKGN